MRIEDLSLSMFFIYMCMLLICMLVYRCCQLIYIYNNPSVLCFRNGMGTHCDQIVSSYGLKTEMRVS